MIQQRRRSARARVFGVLRPDTMEGGFVDIVKLLGKVGQGASDVPPVGFAGDKVHLKLGEEKTCGC